MANNVLAGRMGIKIGQLNRLVGLANKANNAQVAEHNTPNSPDSGPTLQAVEDYAKQLGFAVQWPGLYPTFHKDGETFHMPD